MDRVCALLAFTTFQRPVLGKFEDVVRYHEKSLQATNKRTEIYGPRCDADTRQASQSQTLKRRDVLLTEEKGTAAVATSLIHFSIRGTYLNHLSHRA